MITFSQLSELGWDRIGTSTKFVKEDTWYLFKNHRRNKWSIYEKQSDCLNRDENFGIAINFTLKNIDELKMIMKMTEIN